MSKEKEKEKPTSLPGLESGNGLDFVSTPQEGLPSVRVPKGPTYLVGGHYVDQTLKHKKPSDKEAQLSMMSTLMPSTREKILSHIMESDPEILAGPALTASQYKLMDCVHKLLYMKSQNSDPDKEDFYTGNLGHALIPYGQGREKAPRMSFTAYEIAKEYVAGEAVDGAHIKTVLAILKELAETKHLLKYTAQFTRKGGNVVKTEIEEYQPLIKLINYTEEERDKNGKLVSPKKRELMVMLNPLLIHQIKNKFLRYPSDIAARMKTAYGSPKISTEAYRLRDFLATALSYGRSKSEIHLEDLYWKLNEKYMGELRVSLVEERTKKAINTMLALGLLEGYEIVSGLRGPKVCFKINAHWG